MPEQDGEDYDSGESWAGYKDKMRSIGEESNTPGKCQRASSPASYAREPVYVPHRAWTQMVSSVWRHNHGTLKAAAT